MKIAGFGYAFFHEQVRDFNRPIGYDEFSGHIYDVTQPLIFQPGEGFEYGVRIAYSDETKQKNIIECP